MSRLSAAAQALLVLGVAAAAGCSLRDIPYRCGTDADCVQSGDAGTCEPSGYCSWADQSCESKRRYGALAPPDKADECVPICVTQLALGALHSCAVMLDGTVRCWGDARDGQLGNDPGAAESYPSPFEVDPIVSPVTALAAGSKHTCAVQGPDGVVWCWGNDNLLQLGAPKVGPKPVRLATGPASAAVVEVSAGLLHTCARGAWGIACWGNNEFGQLGIGTLSTAEGPNKVNLKGDFVQVGAGGAHTCARPALGKLECWGNNQVMQLGDNDKAPKPLPWTTNVVANDMALGVGHTCALVGGDQVRCWGSNQFLQLGKGPAAAAVPFAVEVPLLIGAKTVCAGASYSCALLVDDRVACWGLNEWGQLGPNAPDKPTSEPVLTELPSKPVELDCGGEHVCVRTEIGTIYCWGRNDSGQLGNGTTESTATPDPEVTRALSCD